MGSGTVYQFPIIIYPSEDDEGGRFTAHCLSTDLIAEDDTVESAVDGLLETIEAGLEAAKKHNANIFREAPQKYWDMLANAQPLSPELKERIVFNANKRLAGRKRPLIDIEKACDLRQLQSA